LQDGKHGITLFSMAHSLTTVCVKFPPEDLAILEALEGVERLKRSDIVRRAVRAYAKQLGVLDEKAKSKKR
jgi:hypothetical protein